MAEISLSAEQAAPTVYVASKSKYGAMWQDYRTAWADLGLTVISTWIDEWQVGATASTADLWTRCVAEASEADFLVCVAHYSDVLKGALVEIGAALGAGKPVYVCPAGDWSGGSPARLGSWVNHPLVTVAADPDDAIEDYRTFHLKTEWRLPS